MLSTGLDCQQSMRTVPGKAVLFGLMSLVSSPYSMLVQPPWRRLLKITRFLLLALQVSAQADILHRHGPNQGTRRRVLCRAGRHTVPTCTFARHDAGALSEPSLVFSGPNVAIACSTSACFARQQVRHVLSSPSYGPPRLPGAKASRARPPCAGGERSLLAVVAWWYGRVNRSVRSCPGAILRRRSARPLAPRGMRTSRGGCRAAAVGWGGVDPMLSE